MKYGRRIPRPAAQQQAAAAGSPCCPMPTSACKKGHLCALPAAGWHRFRAGRVREQWSRFWKNAVPLNRIKLTVLEEPQWSDCLPTGCSRRQRLVTVPLLRDSPGSLAELVLPAGMIYPIPGWGAGHPRGALSGLGGESPGRGWGRRGRAAALCDVSCH